MSILKAVSSYHKGWRAAWSSNIRSYTAIPLIINIIVFGLSFYILAVQASALEAYIAAYHFEGWLSFLNRLMSFMGSAVYWLCLITSVTIVAFLSNIITCLVAAFFNSKLSNHIVLHYNLATNVAGHSSVWRDMKREISKLWYIVTVLIWVGVLSLVLMFIPGAQLMIPVLWWIASAWVIGVEYLDIPADNHNFSFGQTKNILRTQRVNVMVFGSMGLLLLSAPLLNLVMVPIIVAAGTFYWHEIA